MDVGSVTWSHVFWDSSKQQLNDLTAILLFSKIGVLRTEAHTRRTGSEHQGSALAGHAQTAAAETTRWWLRE